MADQAEAERGSAEQRPEPLDLMERSSERLDEITGELEDRPVLQQAIMQVSKRLEGAAYVLGPAIVTVPKEHNNRLHDVLMAAFHEMHKQAKATETPEQALPLARRMIAIQDLADQNGRHLADYSLSVRDTGLLSDLLIASLDPTSSDEDPWTKWVDGMISVLRDAKPAGSVA